mmetsp:Transcript_18708/g.22933  ORF Transcript_18708/g.22933 Transcript_18708/m.22933 type:complete len:227 (+) Transcript_18708:123-803(+)
MASNEEEAPSWLSDASAPTPMPTPSQSSTEPPLSPPSFVDQSTKKASTSNVNNASAAPANTPSTELTEEEKLTLRNVILIMRLINLGVSIAVVAFSVLMTINIPSSQYWVLAFYSACGGCLICCLETQLRFIRVIIAMNFGFLFNPTFRFAYYILLATICYSFENLFGKILAGCLVGVACYNTYILIKYPAYRKMRDTIAKEEDERINAQLRDRVRKEATANMFRR